MTPITYQSEQPRDYAKGLWEADTLAKLKAFLAEWRDLAADAISVVEVMDEEQFGDFRYGLEQERRGEFAGFNFATLYAAITMPKALFKVSMVAIDFGVPWGCAYLRLKETGNLDRALR